MNRMKAMKRRWKRKITGGLLTGMTLVATLIGGSMTVCAEEAQTEEPAVEAKTYTDYESTRDYIEAEFTKTDEITDWSVDAQDNYRIAEGSTETDYLLEAVSWTDRVAGEADIIMTANTQEPSVALYVFTTCFHGAAELSREDVVAKDVKSLAAAYDRVDVIVIDGPNEWAELEDYPGKYGGIHEVKSFDATNANTAKSWLMANVTKWSGAHFTGNVPAAIRKYLFGSIDAEISEENMFNRPSAIYVSADMHYLTNGVAAGNDDESSKLASYATEEFFNFITEHYLGTTKRYFSSSQTGANDSEKYLLVKKNSIYDATYMKVVAGVFNPELYSEGAGMVKAWSGIAPDTDTTPFALTNGKFASDYNYKQDILSAGIRLPDKQMALSNTVSEAFEITGVEAFTTSGMNVTTAVDGQNVRATAESFLSGDEITMIVHVKLRNRISTTTLEPLNLSDLSVYLDGDTTVMTLGSVKLMPVTTSLDVGIAWNDEENRDGLRPDKVEITLTGSDGSTYSVILDAENEWKSRFDGLSIYYNGGEEIVYTLAPPAVAEYEVATSLAENHRGLNFTLTHTPVTRDIVVYRKWSDGNNADGIRADVKLTLTGSDGSTYVGTIAKDAADREFSFEKLYAYANGEEITYALTVSPIDGYTSEIKQAKDGFAVTYTHSVQAKAKVAVADSGESNVQKVTSVPKTGDSLRIVIHGCTGLALLATGIVLSVQLVRQRKAEKGEEDE